MYCVKCGVKLGDAEKICPLCGTRAFHPDMPEQSGTPLYPEGEPIARKNTKTLVSLLTIFYVLPAILVVICDWQINQSITWSGYVLGALVLSYVSIVLPMWFKRPNPVIFTPCAFAALAAYLLFINYEVGGHWYLTLALPLTGAVCLIVTAVVTLMRYVPRGALYIFGGALILLGCCVLLLEFLLIITFPVYSFIGWSLYPLVVLVILGLALIYLAIYRPARELIERKFFI